MEGDCFCACVDFFLGFCETLGQRLLPACIDSYPIDHPHPLLLPTLHPKMASQPTAILSVYNKTGLLELAKALHAKGVKLLGSGGTAKMVRDAGIDIG